ncbi:hypothetical protein ABB37_07162 [Leptomonas pyrrhocoris]|uniref:Cilia- and flagella-associated protein 263 n=1 Tax=Leptomonas pyrrhocoris TaxID=157538 RepID=A0A0M9FWA8_LEPPY|nr:hypothetical protein ABB37_07162 [Leptomonas pyrrhocoris]KPA77267.1 hypothetical protein ABB37_07162 [Leptomonas pyrrhocoris]|eukprot:XP_015655706.1 hypothetical protein ABB37_07162 [Leptomonas pyrrhocoris]
MSSLENTASPSKRVQRFSDSASSPLPADSTAGTMSAGDDFNALLVAFYTRTYPAVEVFAQDVADLEPAEMNDAVTELATEVAALREETEVLAAHVQTLQERRPVGEGSSGGPHGAGGVGTEQQRQQPVTDIAGSSQNDVAAPVSVTIMSPDSGSTGAANHHDRNDDSSSTGGGLTITTHRGGATGTRRGRNYRRRSLGALDVFVRVDDKAALLRQETARLRSQEERITKEADGVQEILVATVEEAIRRQQELKLEMLQFHREVVGDEGDTNAGAATALRRNPLQAGDELAGSAAAIPATTAEELLRYLERRHTTQVNYLDKLEVQCQAVEQDIARAQQLVRQRRIAGEAFQAVDLEQLRIEHKQFTERMAAKNNELAELKGTSTRTVQQLNHLMGQLNELASEQTRLKRESKSRTEYLSRCDKEYTTATAEAVLAESKHDALKAQQEAIRAPKIEEYMAQKAEEVELEKAVKNWERKVQIAEGQASVVRQHVRRMQSQRTAAVKYASEKRQHHQQQQRLSMAASSKPVVGGARSLLQQRRQQHQQQEQQQAAVTAPLAAAPAEPATM